MPDTYVPQPSPPTSLRAPKRHTVKQPKPKDTRPVYPAADLVFPDQEWG
jgi:hypothetical protein